MDEHELAALAAANTPGEAYEQLSEELELESLRYSRALTEEKEERLI